MTIEERLQRLEDEAEIRALVAQFADACTRADYESFGKVWSESGKWAIHDPFPLSSQGRKAIVNMMAGLREGREFFVQFPHSGVITIAGDKATARWIMHEASKGPGETYYNNYGLYTDALIKNEGKWEFAQRDYYYMYLDTGILPGDAFTLPPGL